MTSVESVRANAERVRNELADAGGDPEAITLLAVTKGFGPEIPRMAHAAGLVDLGESYAQEMVAKLEDPGVSALAAVRWHFIGRLQRNKVRSLASHVACWQSLDRPSVVDEVAKRAPGATVLLQVNATDEPQKGGAAPADVPGLLARARDAGLQVDGLMTIGVAGDSAATAAAFATVARLADDLDLPTRSFGMSGDLAEAVASGTTMVRVGTALFGPRPSRGDR